MGSLWKGSGEWSGPKGRERCDTSESRSMQKEKLEPKPGVGENLGADWAAVSGLLWSEHRLRPGKEEEQEMN